MLRTVAMALLAMNAAHALEDMKPITDAAGKPVATSPEETQAVQVARQKLAGQLRLAPEGIVLERIAAHTWNDASMGCGKPGSMALQVITEGYAVALRAGSTRYRVHVSGDNAVICTQPLLDHNKLRRPSHARGLDLMIERARQDLAGKIGADPADIHLFSSQPQRWADTGLACPRSGESVVTRPVNGYRIALKYRGRVYTYHSDLTDVRACPAIETE